MGAVSLVTLNNLHSLHKQHDLLVLLLVRTLSTSNTTYYWFARSPQATRPSFTLAVHPPQYARASLWRYEVTAARSSSASAPTRMSVPRTTGKPSGGATVISAESFGLKCSACSRVVPSRPRVRVVVSLSENSSLPLEPH